MDSETEAIIIIITLCAVIVGGIYAFSAAFHISTSPGTGQQIGYIAEIENSGILWRPDEIVLIGSEATFSSAQTSWEYASASPEVTASTRQYLKSHEKVVVQYETVLIANGWEYSHPTRITNITKAVA